MKGLLSKSALEKTQFTGERNNPYIGFFQYSASASPATPSEHVTNDRDSSSRSRLPANSGLVGVFRHAPSLARRHDNELSSRGILDALAGSWENDDVTSGTLTFPLERKHKRLSPQDVARIPSLTYAEACADVHNDSIVGQSLCVICMDEFASSDQLRRLPCQHLFHQKCIDQWLLGSGSSKHDTSRCPLCKENALPSPSADRLCEGCKRPAIECRSCGLGSKSRDTFEEIGKEMLGYSNILDGVLSSTIHRPIRRHREERTASFSSRSSPVVTNNDTVPDQSPATVLTTLIRNPLSPLFPFFGDSTALAMDPLCLDDVENDTQT